MARQVSSILVHRQRMPMKQVCGVVIPVLRILLTVLLQQQQHPFLVLAHSGCWDNSNSNNNIVIPFWNIAARHQQHKRNQQHQRNLLLHHSKSNNDTSDHDGTIDYCVATSLKQEQRVHHQPPSQQQQRPPHHPRSDEANLSYRGGGAATTSSSKELETSDVITQTDTNTTRVDEGYKPLILDKKYPYHFSFFQKGDGSDEDIDGIPTRYLIMQNYDRTLAKAAVQSTLQWRKEREINTILQRPQIYYDIAKQVFPHYFVDVRDTTNHIIFVQRPALLNLKLAEHNHLTPSKLLEHYIYVNEYLWQILEGKNALATMTSIIDLHGLNLKYLRQGDIVNFMKEFVKTMDHHYPQRANKTLIINAPKWFNLLYKIVSPLLRESTKAKIEIFTRGKRQDKVLKELLGNSNKAEKLLPASFFMKTKDNKAKKDDRKQMMKKNRRGMQTEVEKDVEHETKESNDNPKHAATDGDEAPNSEGDDDITLEEGALIPPSKFEIELREFTMARIKEAGLQMLEVVQL